MYGLDRPILYGVREDDDEHDESTLELPTIALSNPSSPIPQSPQRAFPDPPSIGPSFQVRARSRLKKALAKIQQSQDQADEQKRMNLLEFRAKYIRSTTAEGSTRIAKHAVDTMNPNAYSSALPSMGTEHVPVPLFSPRSFDRPARTPFVEPPKPAPPRLSTPEFRAGMNLILGPEAPLMWTTINAAKRSYPEAYGGQVRGQTRSLAYRYLRYIHGSKDFSDDALREYMQKRADERRDKDKISLTHENALAEVIRSALDTEVVADIRFNKAHITEEQMKLIMLKAATTEDQIELYNFLIDEVTEEILFKEMPCAMKLIEEEIIKREDAALFDMDSVLSTMTIRQLRNELQRYGKSEVEFRDDLNALPQVDSPAIRGVLRKQCLIKLLLEQRKMYGYLEKGERVKAEIRPWTSILRNGTPTTDPKEDMWERRRRRFERKKKEAEEKGRTPPATPQFFKDNSSKTFVDPFVRSQMVKSLLSRYKTAGEVRAVMAVNGMETKTEGLKGEERRQKLANNLVDNISKNDDLFRAWKAVLMQGEFRDETDVVDDLVDFSSKAPPSRSLNSRGTASRRRRVRMRPQSMSWRPDGTHDDFARPSTDSLDRDWVKRKKGEREEWFNKITGEVIPIHMFFSPEQEPGGFGVDYLEKLLERGVSLPVKSDVEGMSLADFGFIPQENRPTTAYDDKEFEDYMRNTKIRLRARGLDKPGSEVAYQRSILKAKIMYEMKIKGSTRKGQSNVRGEGSNIFVVQSRGNEDDDDDDEEFIAEYIVSQVEKELPQLLLEGLLLKFGAGPPKPPKKGKAKDAFMSIRFLDEAHGYESMEDFKFYYSKLEVPVARNKAILLKELLMRVRRRNWDDDSEDSEGEEEGESLVVEAPVDVPPKTIPEDESERRMELEPEYELEPEPEPEPEPELELEVAELPRMLEWARYQDDNGWEYWYNSNTGKSQYENPFDYDSEDESDEEREAAARETEGKMFVEFCCIMVQRVFRGNRSRKETRKIIAKKFRKIRAIANTGVWAYEDVTTGQIYEKRPSIFKFLWPHTKF